MKHVKYESPSIQWYVPNFNNVISLGTPMEYFDKYITKEMYQLMTDMTNLYAVQNNNQFLPTKVDEMKVFIGLLIAMGTLGYPRLRLYWDTKLSIPLFTNAMQFNRFSKLRQNFHIVDVTKNTGDDRSFRM